MNDQDGDQATEAELRELFSMDPEDELKDVIRTCAGEWQRYGDIWKFHEDPDFGGLGA